MTIQGEKWASTANSNPWSNGIEDGPLAMRVFVTALLWLSTVKSCCAITSGKSALIRELCLSLQVPQDEWTGYTPRGKDDEIPCRRMRSGSYIKAMGDDDSGDSDTSPKPSPKIAARRESYLKATQPSLTELTTLK